MSICITLGFKFKKVGEHRSERNKITSSQLTDTGELIKVNTAYCDKFLGNTPRNLIWNNIGYTMLCEKLSLRVSTLLKGLIRRHAQKKKETLQYTAKKNILDMSPIMRFFR